MRHSRTPRSETARARRARPVVLETAIRTVRQSTWSLRFGDATLHAVALLSALVLSGCFSIPRPRRFEDVDAAKAVSVKSYAAWSDGATLVLDVTPHYAPYRGLSYFIEGDSLYLQAHYDFTLGAPTINTIGQERLEPFEGFHNRDRQVLRYRIDTAKLGLAADWTSKIFWLVEAPGYFILGPAAFIEARRRPAKRKNIVVGGAPPAIGYAADGAR